MRETPTVAWCFHAQQVPNPEIRLPVGSIPAGPPKQVFLDARSTIPAYIVYWWELVGS